MCVCLMRFHRFHFPWVFCRFLQRFGSLDREELEGSKRYPPSDQHGSSQKGFCTWSQVFRFGVRTRKLPAVRLKPPTCVATVAPLGATAGVIQRYWPDAPVPQLKELRTPQPPPKREAETEPPWGKACKCQTRIGLWGTLQPHVWLYGLYG